MHQSKLLIDKPTENAKHFKSSLFSKIRFDDLAKILDINIHFTLLKLAYKPDIEGFI